jgi:hypothetical protein
MDQPFKHKFFDVEAALGSMRRKLEDRPQPERVSFIDNRGFLCCKTSIGEVIVLSEHPSPHDLERIAERAAKTGTGG